MPPHRREIVDALAVGMRRHMVHALLELDVSRPRRLLREPPSGGGEPLSFTAFVVASLARAIERDPLLHACRDWRGRLVLFDDADIVTLIEGAPGAPAVPHVIRSANRRSVGDISAEIRRIRSAPAASVQRSGPVVRASRFVPGPLRRLFFRLLRRQPHLMKRTAGTALVTSVGMFGAGAAWAIGIVPLHTTCLTVGGITTRPLVVDGRIVPREVLSLTLSVDHDIVDGAPAARFAAHLRELIERAALLTETGAPDA